MGAYEIDRNGFENRFAWLVFRCHPGNAIQS